jgi:sigma-B regulation protein RsbU (phosphoserine phosphatase)
MKRDFSPKTILEQVNNSIFKNNPEEMFVTVWLGVLDLVTGTLRAVNAGHECPMLMHPGEYFELVNDRHGFVLGGMMDVKYHEYELQMEPGSKLFVYTDGLIEAVNTRGQEFETYRVLAALNKVRNERPEQIINQVREEEAKFVKGTRPFDDLTMLCLAYNGPKKEEEGKE